jgi:hypothetical protein
MDLSEADPKGLIRESYRIEGITAGECRSIFVDWALSLPTGSGFADHARFLLSVYGIRGARPSDDCGPDRGSGCPRSAAPPGGACSAGAGGVS